MKKLMILLALLLANLTNAQKIGDASKIEQANFVKNEDVQKMIIHAKELGFFKNGTIVKSESKNIQGNDGSGNVSISLIVYSISNENKQTFEIVQLAKNANESTIWGETDKKLFNISKGKITIGSLANAKTGGDCYKIFKKGTADCSQCISCVNNCIVKNKKWQRISCALFNCSGSCWSCITDIYGFIKCVFN